tara:strand:- start:711 stop:1304 length:594 start_codon:yes stop_codon:yes gene_type:complete
MTVLALSTSQAPSSINYRGLQLLDSHCKFTKVDCLSNYDIPVVNVNGIDSYVPDSVRSIISSMFQYDNFVFAIPEFTGMMSSSTKNLLDWMVVISNMNLEHGKGYPFSDKHVILLTFTPSGDEGGSRHMPQTQEVFKKLGANVIYSHVFTYGWKHVVPGNEEYFHNAADKINNYLLYKATNKDYFKNEYIKWNEKWK